MMVGPLRINAVPMLVVVFVAAVCCAPVASASVVDSHILYLNPCKPNGCTVKLGPTDSRTDHADFGSGTLSAYSGTDQSWTRVVDCVKAAMSPFNLTVTDIDPGTVDHFEVMIAGSPQQLGLPPGIGGIADVNCSSPGRCSHPWCTKPGECKYYVPNALAFDFELVWGGNVNENCSTAAQEIAHAWALDHVVDASDVMTYNNYAGMRTFHDGEVCGSDCINGTSPFGLTCTGQQHICMGTGTATQDEIKIITELFGPAGAQPPTVTIVSPINGATQPTTGLSIEATCTSPDGIQEVDLSIDGMFQESLTSAPFKFTLPTGMLFNGVEDPRPHPIREGPHRVSVLCATKNQATATAEIDVRVRYVCSADSDCVNRVGGNIPDGSAGPTSDICYEHACIAGPGAIDGLGATCTNNSACASGLCGSDGNVMLCVVPCDPNSVCPSGFACVQAGKSSVCWPGSAAGGCCNTGGNSGAAGSILFGFGFIVLLIARRRRR